MTAKDAEVTIKTSTYSNTPVIELIYKGMSVLRRSGYLAINGTQILTIGGVTERAKRARILDVKCIGEGWPVEKVQGGAGKFQGTWMPVVHALQLAKDYGVEKIVQQLVDYVPPANSAAASVISVHKEGDNPGSGTSTPVGQPGRRGRRKATDDGGNQVPAKKQRTDDSEDEVFAAPSKPLLFVRPDATRADKSKAFLLSLFISSTPQTTTATKKSWPDYLSLATPLDVKGNTAVHWAASLGHTDTLQEILAFAATHKDNPLTSVNYAQETALMRALHLPNNHIRKSFPLILSLLPTKDLLHLKDAHNQTLFHHAVASVIASSISIEACVYYLSCIKDVFGLLHPAQEGASSSSASTTSSSSSLKLESSSVSFLNEKDWNGDTALSLARRCIPGAGPIADLLISMGASDIPDPVSFEAAKKADAIAAKEKAMDIDLVSPIPIPATAVEPPKPHTDDTTPFLGNPEFVAKSQEIQTTSLTLMNELSTVYAKALHSQELALIEAEDHVSGLMDKVAELRKKNKGLRGQNVKLSETAHRIGMIQKSIEAELAAPIKLEQQVPIKENAGSAAVSELGETDALMRDADNTNPLGNLEQEIERLQARFDELEEEGRRLGLQKTALRVHGHGDFSESVSKMRKIIAFSCQVPMDQIDQYLEPLLAALQSTV